MDEQPVTLGEVYRLCLSIQRDVRAQNGRVRALERDAARLKTVWVLIVIALGLGIDWAKRKMGLV